MSTLATMKAEIEADLGRSDLSSYVASCIDQAIEREQITRFFFNISRDMTFSTAAGTWRYNTLTSGPVTSFDDIVEIDDVWIEDSNGQRYGPLSRIDYEWMELFTDNQKASGRPTQYAVYDGYLWLYPVPDQAYTVRISGHYKYPAPPSDTETGNAWMTHGYLMILSLAKSIIYQNRIRDFNKAQADYQTYLMARRNLLKEGTRKLADRRIVATEF